MYILACVNIVVLNLDWVVLFILLFPRSWAFNRHLTNIVTGTASAVRSWIIAQIVRTSGPLPTEASLELEV